MAQEWVELVKRDMSVAGRALNRMGHIMGCWKGRAELK